ncbi:MAG: phosphoglycolate phosphatase [Thermoplasmata archaeon]|nr:phosphoglycolate phosphatase [Thermoplasmata archaeon]
MSGRKHRPSVCALAIDIDGTLTDKDRRLHLPALRALQRLHARGVPVIIATGNVLPIALALTRFFGLPGPIVAENGGLLYERVEGRELVTRLAHLQPARRAAARLVRAGLVTKPLFTNRWRETEVAFEPTFSVARARRVLRGSGIDVVPTGFAIHLIERGCGKLGALERALSRFGLGVSDCFVAGDGDNDVEMLRAAGFAVSFPTASPRARAEADYITRRPYALGFVEALKQVRVLVPPRTG